jgi:hypothetical protein
VVGVAAAVVADGGADVLGDAVDVAQDVLDLLALPVGVLADGLVQLVRVRLVMAIVVDLHGAGVDVGLEGVVP